MSTTAEAVGTEIMGMKQVAARLRVTPLTLRRWFQSGSFPKPRQPAGRKGRLFWSRDVVEAWIRDQA